MKKSIGFTLSEVLITIGIIGVVAALTIPVLMDDYSEKAMVTTLRKTINDFETAADMYITEQGKTKLSHTNALSDIDSFMSSKFKARSGSGFATSYRSIKGTSSSFTCSGEEYILPSSAAVCISTETDIKQPVASPTGKPHDEVVGKYAPHMHIYVDVNGKDKPNVGGIDMYDFYITNNGTFATSIEATYDDGYGPITEYCGTNSDGTQKECTPCLDNPFGEGCVQKLEGNNWKMNY